MKRNLLLCLLSCLMCSGLWAQTEMAAVWNKDIGFKSEYQGLSDSKGYFYSASAKEMSVGKTEDGSVLWTAAYKDIAPNLKKVDELIPLWEANAIFLFDRKAGKDQIGVIDATTGKLLWTSEKYQNVTEDNVIYIEEMDAFAISLKEALVMIGARTGEELWETSKFSGAVGDYVYMSDGSLIMLNYKPTALGALFKGFKNQLVRINTKNGDIMWDQTYVGVVEKKVITREAVVDLSIEGDKIFLTLNGLQVFDYNTGQTLWAAAFDATPVPVKAPQGAKKFGVYGAVADPVVVGNDVYIIDFGDGKKQKLKKYDLNTGKLLWTSPEIKGGARAIPGMYVSNGRVVLQIGGIVEAQAFIVRTEKNSDGSTTIIREWKVWYPNVKPNGLQAFDSENGQLVWESERFKKGITNAFVSDGKVFVCSGKAFYRMDVSTGAEEYEIDFKDDGVGLAQKIMDYKDKVIVIAQKGVASHNKSDGSMACAGRWGNCELMDYRGGMIVMQTAKSDVAAFNPENCQYTAYNAKKGAVSMVSDDGKFIYVWEKKDVNKLSTK